jgi:ferrous iron transport protein B
MMKIALTGNPNSGKTTLFNAITGKTEYVGNWPGVTVEKKVANLKRHFNKLLSQYGEEQITVVDLPGAYSISPYTGEEAITRDYVLDENPDVIINIIDANSLERSLFFTTQLMEFNIPVVIALNKQDLLKKHHTTIDLEGLAQALQCEIIETTANAGEGLDQLLKKAAEAAAAGTQAAPCFKGKETDQEDKARQSFIKTLTRTYVIEGRKAAEITYSDKIDRIVANPVLGLPIFGLIMWAVYAFSISGLGGWLSEYFNETLFGEIVPDAMNTFFEGIGVHPLLQALIVDGAIGGVGAVIGFLPLIMVLFFCLGLLEDSGYMARVALVMDRYFKKIGLSGKSIIPMIVGSGCSIPGVMAARTIEDDDERKMTTMLTPFVPCGAKLPIIALFAVVFFPGATWVFPAMYMTAGAMIIIGGLLLKRIFNFESTPSFIIELPEYKVPSLKHAFTQMIKQAKAFIIKASTIILVMNTLVWLLQTYSWNFQVAEEQSLSMLASFGSVLAPLLIPLGFVGWQMAAATLTGFVAKENVVATFAVVLAASEEMLFVPGGSLTTFFNPVTGMAFLIFNLFTPPCFAAIGAMNSELASRKWLKRALLFQIGVGYTLAMLVTQLGTIIVYGELAAGFVPSVFVLAVITAFVFYVTTKGHTKLDANLSTSRE